VREELLVLVVVVVVFEHLPIHPIIIINVNRWWSTSVGRSRSKRIKSIRV